MDSNQHTLKTTASSADAGLRIDHFLAAAFPRFSRSRLQLLIKNGAVLLNGTPTKPKQNLNAGDIIEIQPPPETTTETLPEEIPLTILYEDDDLMVINKPSGMVVHPAVGNEQGTLVNALLHHCDKFRDVGGPERPGIVHRLDKDTSGCLVVAKNELSHQHLSGQFASRNVTKIYLALVHGIPDKPHATINAPIGRHPVNRQKMAVLSGGRGKPATTDYSVIQSWDQPPSPLALLCCHLHTGRTHQIRVHLRHVGHPIVDDPIYGNKRSPSISGRLMLHAWQLGFTHPTDGNPLAFEAPPPPAFSPWQPDHGWQPPPP